MRFEYGFISPIQSAFLFSKSYLLQKVLRLSNNINRPVLKLRKQDGNVIANDPHNQEQDGKHKADQHYGGSISVWRPYPGPAPYGVNHHGDSQNAGTAPGIDPKL